MHAHFCILVVMLKVCLATIELCVFSASASVGALFILYFKEVIIMFNYDNIGEKIKGLAKWTFIVEAIGAVIGGIAIMLIGNDYFLAGFLTLIFGPIVAWVASWILYGFGELVDSAILYQKNGKATPIVPQQIKVQAPKPSSTIKITNTVRDTQRHCAFCGKALPAGITYCEHCDEKAESTNSTKAKTTIPGFQQYKICPHCGEIIKSSPCYVCGKPNKLFD